MLSFKSQSVAALAAAALFMISTAAMGAQGNSGGRANGPKPSAPVQSGKPATPPGQAKQPAGAPAQHGTPKPATPLTIKPGLGAKIQPLLPPGMTVDVASAGFKNVGQFVAAAHVAKNLDLPFASLKTEMVDNGHSLGDAIHTLKPDADAKAEATRAEVQAKADISVSTR